MIRWRSSINRISISSILLSYYTVRSGLSFICLKIKLGYIVPGSINQEIAGIFLDSFALLAQS